MENFIFNTVSSNRRRQAFIPYGRKTTRRTRKHSGPPSQPQYKKIWTEKHFLLLLGSGWQYRFSGIFSGILCRIGYSQEGVGVDCPLEFVIVSVMNLALFMENPWKGVISTLLLLLFQRIWVHCFPLTINWNAT